MGWVKVVLGAVFTLVVVGLLAFYWFIPTKTFVFNIKEPRNYNFSLSESELEGIQFYSKMRFPEKDISYRINDECTLKKKNDVEMALDILENETILNFNRVMSNEDVSIECEERIKIKEEFFIAGEGGPTNITKTDNFNVIHNGAILLIRESNCERPNIAIHEFLHVLGFDHSSNPNNIMYEVVRCEQTLGEDIPILIDELYSVPSLPDLSFEDVSAIMRGRYLDVNMSIRNNGLMPSENTKIKIYSGDNVIKETDLKEVEVGYGLTIILNNILVPKLNVEDLEVVIESDFDELDKENNKIKLEIKK